MSAREIHLERLIGTKVRDAQGGNAGTIEEIVAERRGDDWEVTEVLTGPVGLLTRLSALGIGAWLLDLLGARKSGGGCTIPWQELDLSDPERPKLRCPVSAVRDG